MEVLIEIAEIDNGFVINTFDSDGKASNDKKTFIEDWVDVIKFVDKWYCNTLELSEE